jgi:hypothetical protein
VAKADEKAQPLASADAPRGAPAAAAAPAPASRGAAAVPVGSPAPLPRSPLADVGPTGGEHQFVRVLSIGYGGLAAQHQSSSSGPGLFFSARDEDLVLSLSVEKPGPTLGLAGVGMLFHVLPRWNVVASAVGGFDAVQQPSVNIMPALGARAGLEWMGSGSTTFGFCVTTVSDLVRTTDATGQSVGGLSVSAALTAGWVAR